MMIPLALTACAVTPLTQSETELGVAHSLGAQACYQRGWVNNPSVMVAYLNAVQSNLRARGDQALISQAERKMSAATIRIEDCRQLEMIALQYAQQQAEKARQQQAFDEAMDSLSQSAQQIQSQYQPRTTTCQHYQWGNMTSCTSY